ncbi:DNA-directed RNA polymerase I subunit RPA34.5 [Microdochium nivale]|nr:DNA-directed RNA polymerase I subunit RPA34.5 [Microdochium nivale]
MAPTTPAKVDGKPIASDKDAEFLILVMQSLKTEPVIDFDKLAQLSGMASKASANTKWYKLRHKYMPGGVSPKKRKDDGGNDSSAGSGEAKAAKKPRTPRKTNKSPKKEDPKDEEELDEDDETAIKADPFRVKSEED